MPDNEIDAMAISAPDEADIRLWARALGVRLADMPTRERLQYVEGFYRRYFASEDPGRVYRAVASTLRPFLVELVRIRGQGPFSDGAAVARMVDELYAIRTEDSLTAMLGMTSCEAVLMYAIRKFPLAEQPSAVAILRSSGVRPLGLRPVSPAFYHESVVRWMLEGFVERVRNDPDMMASQPDRPPASLHDSPLLRSMDAVYQLHRQGFFGASDLRAWWSRILRALRPAADRLATVDAFLVDQGDPVGLVDSVFSLVSACRSAGSGADAERHG